MSALTPGLSALLDTSISRFARDAKIREVTRQPVTPRPELDGQLALFDVNADGSVVPSVDAL